MLYMCSNRLGLMAPLVFARANATATVSWPYSLQGPGSYTCRRMIDALAWRHLSCLYLRDQTSDRQTTNFFCPEQPVSRVLSASFLLTSCWWIWIQKAAFQRRRRGALILSASFQALQCDFTAWIKNRTVKEKWKDGYRIKKTVEVNKFVSWRNLNENR